MNAATAQAPIESGSVRRFPRFSLSTPVDILILRSGIPDTIPGRSLNVSEGGMAAILAAELRSGQTVGVELVIPEAHSPVRAKATVKYHTELLCGLEFQGLSQEQKALLRSFSGRPLDGDAPTAAGNHPAISAAIAPPAAEVSEKSTRAGLSVRRLLIVALLSSLAVLVLGWWQWQQSWKQLEQQASTRKTAVQGVRVRVPSQEMEKLLLRRIDPIYPEIAREENLRGIVLLTAVIGRDGSVLDLEPVSGPDVLTSAARDAVRWWRFQPYELNGSPAEVQTTLAVEFTP